jgi:hypothetical protein
MYYYELKKAHLDYIYYELGRQRSNYKACILNKTKEGRSSSKWRSYGDFGFSCDYAFISQLNQREVLQNEVVLDIEDISKLERTMVILERMGIRYAIYKTHSKGLHVHIWFRNKLNDKKRKRIIMFFEADLQVKPRHLIALENAIHWKSGKRKELIRTNISNLKDKWSVFNENY